MPRIDNKLVRKHIQALKRTRAIRKKVPNWAVGFATVKIEDGTPIFITAKTAQKAEIAITNFGIKETSATKMKELTSGHAWYEGATLYLAIKRGAFMTASRAITACCRSMVGVALTNIKQAKKLTDADVKSISDADPDAIAKIDAEAGDDEDDDAALVNSGIEPATDLFEPSSPTDEAQQQPEAAPPPPEPEPDLPDVEDDAPLTRPAGPDPDQVLSERERASARKSAKRMSKVLGGTLAHILAEAPKTDELMGGMVNRFEERLAQADEDMRADLLKTGPARMLMDWSRAAVMGWDAAVDVADRIEQIAPETPLSRQEVVDHFVDIASRVLHEGGKSCKVSRAAIEKRVDGLFDENAPEEEKLSVIERLTKGMLPAVSDADRAETLLGAKAPQNIEDVEPSAIGLGAVTSALSQAIGQINACRNAYDDGIAGETAEGMASEDHEFFDALAAELRAKTDLFVEMAQALAERMEDGAAVPQNDLVGVRYNATRMRADVIKLAHRIDRSGIRPTRIAGLYTGAVDGFLKTLSPG